MWDLVPIVTKLRSLSRTPASRSLSRWSGRCASSAGRPSQGGTGNAGLWLVQTDHVTWILTSDWSCRSEVNQSKMDKLVSVQRTVDHSRYVHILLSLYISYLIFFSQHHHLWHPLPDPEWDSDGGGECVQTLLQPPQWHRLSSQGKNISFTSPKNYELAG